jgi:DNA invertase Pin-like site-specific DNA recombinase
MGKRTSQKTDPAVAVGYVRVSKDDQRLSPSAQAKSIERFAREHGLRLVAYALDLGVCSADEADDRPGLSLALNLVRDHKAATLLVAKRDRLGRDVWVVGSVERVLSQGGATLVSAAGEGNGTTPADAFMRHVVDGAAEYERALIRSRTKAALATIRERGQKTGGSVPLGYALAEDGRTLVANAAEQAIIARARALRAEGLPLAAIADTLTAEHLLNRKGRAFAAMQVSRMLGEGRAA